MTLLALTSVQFNCKLGLLKRQDDLKSTSPPKSRLTALLHSVINPALHKLDQISKKIERNGAVIWHKHATAPDIGHSISRDVRQLLDLVSRPVKTRYMFRWSLIPCFAVPHNHSVLSKGVGANVS